ncbi:DUF885 family protein [Croceitalea rosinachiae]|uniref:DUF885 family protein n=1 Tax=Croceitalea rosinachiae TaxID=3075596 RepID=A0ABU3ADF2_9FLAO|nr:DUF885 family protein [Croceitalea sp. F388]MDT0608217.1 DUF885 family protein [Croceitalea sp. F388]
MKQFYLLATIILVPILLFGFSTNDDPSINSHEELVNLFKEWRTFENPPKLNGVPDYSLESFEKRWPTFKALETKLVKIDTTDWSIAQRVDWHIVRAEMNGYDFNHKILKPWVRDPAFYKVIWMSRSDVPAHEGPTNHTTIEIWTYDFPLDNPSREKLLTDLNKIPEFYRQAKQNLTGNARDLWVTGIRDIKNQSKNLKAIREWEYLKTDKKLIKAIDTAIEATNELANWLEKEGEKKTGPSGIGKENYTWYLQNVHLVPMTWEDEVQLLKRELARAWSALKLEEHRNRNLPKLKAASNPEEFQEMTEKAADDLLQFLAVEDIVTVKDYFKPALYAHLGTFIPEEKRNFFEIGRHYHAGPLYSHFYHWFELARMDIEPHQSEIRKGALLYNIFDSRNEGMATGVEEIFMDAGLYDDNPRVREIVYIMIAQRAARGLGSLYAHANQMTMEEAGGIHSEFTPRGWMKTEKELLIFEQHLYLRQPGYGTSYITGKYLMESAMADFAKMKEAESKEFRLKDFFDQLNTIGNIPISLGHWQMTGVNNHLNQINN